MYLKAIALLHLKKTCLLYTSDAADEGLGVDLGVRRIIKNEPNLVCLLYTSPSPRDRTRARMPSSA